MAYTKPKQRIPTSKKLKDKDWQKQTAFFFREACSNYSIDPSRALILYRAANGEMEESDYMEFTHPFRKTGRSDLQGYPSKIRNIDIIRSNINTFMGEKSQRPTMFEVIVRNSDFPSKLKQTEHDLILSNIERVFVNELIQAGVYDGQSKPPDSPEVIKRQLSNVSDQKAIYGQDFLDYTYFYNEIPRMWRKGFYHWLVTGRVFSYKDVVNQDLSYEIVPIPEISYMKSGDTDFLEDCEAVKRSKIYSVTECIDKFSDFEDFDEDMIRSLEQKDSGAGGGLNELSMFSSQYAGLELMNDFTKGRTETQTTNNPTILVEHVVFTSQVKVGRRFFVDEEGNGQEDVVSEDYIPTEDEEIRWIWVGEKWEVYVIDNKYVIGAQPLPLTRAAINNPYKTKGPYNGRLLQSFFTDPMSIVDIGIPFQISYNLVHYYIQKIMSKNHDKIIVMPLGLIPEKEGQDMFTTMYHADASGFLFVDDTNQNAMNALNAVKVLDASLGEYIVAMYNIAEKIRRDWDDSIGMTPQRKGEVKTSAGKGTTQDAIGRGMLVSEEMFLQYEEFEEREAQGFLDLAKYCCVDGKKSAFVGSDYKKRYLDIEPDSLSEVEFGIFAKRSSEEKRKMELLLEVMQPLIQNQAITHASQVAKIIQANNISKLVEDLEELERNLEEKQQKAAEAQQKAEQAAAAAIAQEAKEDRAVEYYKADKNFEASRQNKLDEVEARLLITDKKDQAKIDIAELENLSNQRQENLSKHEERQGKLALKDKEIDVKADTEIKKATIASQNAQKTQNKKD